jgi:hypothetical protein
MNAILCAQLWIINERGHDSVTLSKTRAEPCAWRTGPSHSKRRSSTAARSELTISRFSSPCSSLRRLTMMKILHACLLSLSLVTYASANYDVIPRESPSVDKRKRSLQSDAPPLLVSFDGDLDAILAQALQAAQHDVDDAFACENFGTVQHLEVVSWQYSIETTPSAVASTVFGEVQEITLETTAQTTLACRNPMVAHANIVAMDTAIPSATETTSKCKHD